MSINAVNGNFVPTQTEGVNGPLTHNQTKMMSPILANTLNNTNSQVGAVAAPVPVVSGAPTESATENNLEKSPATDTVELSNKKQGKSKKGLVIGLIAAAVGAVILFLKGKTNKAQELADDFIEVIDDLDVEKQIPKAGEAVADVADGAVEKVTAEFVGSIN
ncbi:MAG: hypothetical protein E7Z91_00205 [Cyanobacteria bacterium SIG30]|nr:hypothetical protein [Cyanobacteria bacterium SIG30]